MRSWPRSCKLYWGEAEVPWGCSWRWGCWGAGKTCEVPNRGKRELGRGRCVAWVRCRAKDAWCGEDKALPSPASSLDKGNKGGTLAATHGSRFLMLTVSGSGGSKQPFSWHLLPS